MTGEFVPMRDGTTAYVVTHEDGAVTNDEWAAAARARVARVIVLPEAAEYLAANRADLGEPVKVDHLPSLRDYQRETRASIRAGREQR